MGAAEPDPTYIQKSLEPSVYLPASSTGKHQLLILDLNGTLISRTKPSAHYYARPHLDSFLKFIFEHFYVMVWSSAQEHSVRLMCHVFGLYQPELTLTWDRSHLDLDLESFYKKSNTIKDLTKVWEVLPQFNATNTIMLDDSPYKLAYQPHNLVHISTFDHRVDQPDRDLLKVMNYFLILKRQSNLSSFMKLNPFCIKEDWGIKADEELDRIMTHFSGRGKRLGQLKISTHTEDYSIFEFPNDPTQQQPQKQKKQKKQKQPQQPPPRQSQQPSRPTHIRFDTLQDTTETVDPSPTAVKVSQRARKRRMKKENARAAANQEVMRPVTKDALKNILTSIKKKRKEKKVKSFTK